MRRFAYAISVGLIAVFAVSVTACSGPDWRVVKLYGGRGSIELIQKPTAVEAFRLAPDGLPKGSETPRFGRFEITSDPVAVSAEDAKILDTILTSPDTYDWHRAKGCIFTPGVGLRFARETSYLDIALCFACDELQIYREGRVVGMEDFDDARPQLLAIAKRLFPADEAISALE